MHTLSHVYIVTIAVWQFIIYSARTTVSGRHHKSFVCNKSGTFFSTIRRLVVVVDNSKLSYEMLDDIRWQLKTN